MIVNGSLVGVYTTYVTGAMSAFLPLVTVVIGAFLAFAIANHLVFMIKKSVGRN